MNFIEKCLTGNALLDEIEEYEETWHNGGTNQNIELHEYLGMTWEEYSLWGSKPSLLASIIRSRKNNTSLNAELESRSLALATRAETVEEAAQMTIWLKKIGKI